MPKGYRHLAYEQRCQIYALLKRGFSQFQISQDLGVDQSTISRELRRNKSKKGYRYKRAQEKATERRRNASSCPHKMNADLIATLDRLLREQQWSPEQLSGYLKKTKSIAFSHERIYQHIWRDKRNGGVLYKNLRCIAILR